jgi:hypothetical protein
MPQTNLISYALRYRKSKPGLEKLKKYHLPLHLVPIAHLVELAASLQLAGKREILVVRSLLIVACPGLYEQPTTNNG